MTRAGLMTLDMQLTKSVVAEHVGREGQLYQQSECLTAQQIATLLGMPVTGRVHKPQGPRSQVIGTPRLWL